MTPQENSPQEPPASGSNGPKPDAAGIGREIVLDAERIGLNLRAVGDAIKAGPTRLLTPAIRWVLKTYKPDVIAALRYRDQMPAAFYTSADARGIPLDAAMARYGVTREPDPDPTPADAPPAWVEKPKQPEQQPLNAAA